MIKSEVQRLISSENIRISKLCDDNASKLRTVGQTDDLRWQYTASRGNT